MLFTILFGAIFAVAGISAFAIMMGAALATKQYMLIPFSFIFLLAFGGVGFGLIISEIKKQRKIKNVLKLGQRFIGTIVEYADDRSMIVNGMPLLAIIVETEINGVIRRFTVKTGTTDESKYPMGASIEIAIYNNDVVPVPNTVRILGTGYYTSPNAIPYQAGNSVPYASPSQKERVPENLENPYFDNYNPDDRYYNDFSKDDDFYNNPDRYRS